MPRILFVTTEIGFGHQQVTNTLASTIRKIIPECNTKIVSYFDFFPSRFELLINRIYLWGLTWFPHVFGYIYLTQKRYRGKGIGFWARMLGSRYAKVIELYFPDLIIITQGLACQWLGWLKRRGLIKVPLAGVITDFTVHPFWVAREIDQYIVATEEMREELISRGIVPDRVAVLGIPIDPVFGTSYNKDKSGKIVLVMGGGWGLGRLDKVVDELVKIKYPVQLLVVTGSNESLYQKLIKKQYGVSVHIYGRVNNISELMAVSDLVVTKPGGVTISELLAMGLPAVLWDVIPGQEEANCEYLVRAGVARKANGFKGVAELVSELVSSPEEITSMGISAQRLGRPNAAVDSARLLRKWLWY